MIRQSLVGYAMAGVVACAQCADAFVIQSMEPTSARRGSSVDLIGTGFVPGHSYSVTLAGQDAPVQSVEATRLVFTVPDEAVSGVVLITEDGNEAAAPTPLKILRDVPVAFSLPNGIVPNAYVVGTVYGDSEEAAVPRTVSIAIGEPTLVIGGRDENDPIFLAVATDSQQAIVLSPNSTALALAFLFPSVSSGDSQEADTILGELAGLEDIQALAALIAEDTAAGRDYNQDARADDATLRAVGVYSASKFPPPESTTHRRARVLTLADAGGIQDDYVTARYPLADGFPRDLASDIDNIVPKILDPARNNSNGVPVHSVYFGAKTRHYTDSFSLDLNPLDWNSLLFELDPDQFPGGMADVRALTAQSVDAGVLTRLRQTPLGSINTPAKLVSKRFNLIDALNDAVASFLLKPILSKETLDIQKDRSGIYVIRSYSGSVFPRQDPILISLPEGRDQDVAMKGSNLLLATFDGISSFVPIDALFDSETLAKLVYKGSVDASRALTRELAEHGEITGDVLISVFAEASKGMVKEVLKAIEKTAFDKGVKLFAVGKLAKTLFKTIDLIGKAANVASAFERLAALTNATRLLAGNAYMSQALETTVVVVGDPFRPEVSSFSPRRAHRGGFVTITGRRFDETNPAANLVHFGGLGTDPLDPSAAAQVVAAKRNSLLVKVPEGAQSGPITVAVAGKGSASSAALSPPYDIFAVIPDPAITGTEPLAAPAGTYIRIYGENFGDSPGLNRVAFGSQPDNWLLPANGDATRLVVLAPFTVGANSVTVKTADRSSNSYPISLVSAPASEGGTVVFTVDVDGNSPDGEVTLREAILIATGQLGRAPTSPPDPRPDHVTYESDYISGTPGAGYADWITPNHTPGTLTLQSPLPDMAGFDTYSLAGLTVDGGGMSADALSITGNYLTVQNATFQNFSGNGLHLSGSAQGCSLENLTFKNSQGDGLLIDGNAQNNVVRDLTVENATGNGIHLTGEGVTCNEVRRSSGNQTDGSGIGSIEGCGGWGVLIEGSASFNAIAMGHVKECTLGGIRVTGATTLFNSIGRQDSSIGLFSEVFDNGGPGVRVEAPHTRVRYVNVCGNQGDGILLEGSDCQDGEVDLVRVGYDNRANVARGNQGSGLHVRGGAGNILIGRLSAASFGARNSFGGNRDYGILIEGPDVDSVDVKHTHVGIVIDRFVQESYFGNGLGGIALVNARNCTIGDHDRSYDVHINAHTTGAGILMSGTQSTGNLVVGCQIGSHHDGRLNVGNLYGIQVTNGAWGNTIGLRGDLLESFIPPVFLESRSRNWILGNTGAGILLESGGDPSQTLTEGETPRGGNVVQNNQIGASAEDIPGMIVPNEVGILIKPGAVENRIGGVEDGEANNIEGNRKAGIEIDGGIVRPNTANRIVGNRIVGTMDGGAGDPLQARPPGVGVLVTGGATGHVVGGAAAGEGNTIADNLVGVYVENSTSVQVSGNVIGGSDEGGNQLAGVIFQNCSGCQCGPANRIEGNGSGNPFLGGVVVHLGSQNKVVGNLIGTDRAPGGAKHGNDPHGVTLLDSSNNTVGDLNGGTNVVVDSTDAGILISGAGSIGNQIAANLVGVDSAIGNNPAPNGGSGVLLESGAANNVIGGLRPFVAGAGQFNLPAGNTILGNGLHGVETTGATTVGNTITFNSITGHTAGVGIRNRNGGNRMLPPPVITEITAASLRGTLDPAIPNGSLVQVFSDPGGEGAVWIGQGTAINGTFDIVPGMFVFPKLTATVTDIGDGSTSQFGVPYPIDGPTSRTLLTISRVGGPDPKTGSVTPGTRGVVLDRLLLTTGGSPVVVSRLLFRAQGTIDESANLTSMTLLQDLDKNGAVSAGDRLLAASPGIGVDDGSLLFASMRHGIDADTEEEWLIVGNLSTEAPFQTTLRFELTSTNDVDSYSLFPSVFILEDGDYPIPSDVLEIGQASSSGWVLE